MTYTYYLKIFSEREKKEIEAKLENQFGIEKIQGIINAKGREKLFLFQGSLDEGEIKKLSEIIPIERVGIYFAKIINDELKLSLDGTNILKDQINKNIFELNDKQAETWMKGQQLDVKTGKKGFLIMKYKDDFLGCGKASENKISNFIPKSRRLK